MGRKANIERDLSIAAALAAGTSAGELARRHGLSAKRIYNIGSRHRNGQSEGSIILAQEQEKAAAAERRAATAESRAHAEIQQHYQGDMLLVAREAYGEGFKAGFADANLIWRNGWPLEAELAELKRKYKVQPTLRSAARVKQDGLDLENGPLGEFRERLRSGHITGISGFERRMIDAGLLPPPPGRPGRRR